MAFDRDGRLICEGIAAVVPGVYGSAAGMQPAARNCKVARDAAAATEAANNTLADAELAAFLADFPGGTPAAPAPRKLVGGHFDGPLRKAAADAAAEARTVSAIRPEYLENMDRAIAEAAARGEKLA